MNLHRAGKAGEWEAIPADERNIFQKVAAKTKGVVTPGNAVSLIGLGLVMSGLKDVHDGHTLKGIVKMGVGRLCDNVDGAVAHATGTKGPIGEAADVVIDKVEMGVAAPVLMKNGILSKRAGAVIIGQSIANTVATMVAKRRGAEIHASAAGKYNVFGQSTMIGMELFANLAHEHEAAGAEKIFSAAADASLGITAALGGASLAGYVRDALAPVPAPEVQEPVALHLAPTVDESVA